MQFEWDEEKDKINKKKHGVLFEIAVRVFLDQKRIERLDTKHSFDEDRYNIIGRVSNTLILFVVCTERNNKTRLISARQATADEENEYYDNYDAR